MESGAISLNRDVGLVCDSVLWTIVQEESNTQQQNRQKRVQSWKTHPTKCNWVEFAVRVEKRLKKLLGRVICVIVDSIDDCVHGCWHQQRLGTSESR